MRHFFWGERRVALLASFDSPARQLAVQALTAA